MIGSAVGEVCGRFVFSLTRSVAEHYNPSETEFNSESFGFNPLESTGLEWNSHPVEEYIFQEYGDREITSTGSYLAFNNAQVRIINACLPDDSEADTTKETEDRAMAWKKHRPSIALTIWCSLYFGFLISIVCATIVGTVFILVYYLNYQAILNCLSRPKESVPINIQWSQTISEIITLVFGHVWFFSNIVSHFQPHQIKGLKRILLLVSLICFVLDSLYRLVLQVFGIPQSRLTRALRAPENALFALNICVQTWVLARHFSSDPVKKKLVLFVLMIAVCVITPVAGILMADFIYPEYQKHDKLYIAMFTPLISVAFKGVSRLCVQRLWRISHPGTSFVPLVPLYCGSAVMLRILQADLDKLAMIALIGIIHGISEVTERSAVILVDYICHQICERRRVPWDNFRSPRRERLATDIAIMSMLYEASAIISVNAFLHFHEYFYTDYKTVLVLLQSFAITTSVPLAIEWFFASVSIAIETRYQNRPVMAVWRRQWKRHLKVAIINAVPIAVWTSTSLLIAIKERFTNTKDYCEMPFSHP